MKNLILSLAHPDGGKTFVIYKTKTKQATLVTNPEQVL